MIRNKRPILALALLLAATAATLAQTTQPKPQLLLGKPAPEILATTLDGKPAKLADYKGKPILLQFGSITEPVFRNKSAAMEKLAADFADKAHFLIIYAEESHPGDTEAALQINNDEGFAIARPQKLEERIKLARLAVDKLTLKNQTMLVDAWNNTSAKRYNDLPNMLFLIDKDGNLATGWPWADPKKARLALEALLAGKPIPAEAHGPRKQDAIAALDPDDMAMGMMGGGPGNFALLLDGMDLSDKQRAAIYPPLATFLAESRNLREQRKEEDKAPDLADAIQKLRTQAQTLQKALKENLKDEDYTAAMKALKSGPGKRFFE